MLSFISFSKELVKRTWNPCLQISPISPDFVDETDEMKNIKEGSWRQDNAQNTMLPLPSSRQNNRYRKNAEAVKRFLADYFYGPDQV